jgi:hypothetical protein
MKDYKEECAKLRVVNTELAKRVEKLESERQKWFEQREERAEGLRKALKEFLLDGLR